MSVMTLRTMFVIACLGTTCLAMSPQENASGLVPGLKERLAARAPSELDGGEGARIDILIERWSTDAERDSLESAFTGSGPDALLSALQKVRQRAGTVLIPGIMGRRGARVRTRHPVNLLFAREVKSDKGRQVIVAAERDLAFGTPTEKWPSEYRFALLDIRFGADGEGTGKVVAAADVVYNKQTRTLEAANFASLPARLTAVRHDTSPITTQ